MLAPDLNGGRGTGRGELEDGFAFNRRWASGIAVVGPLRPGGPRWPCRPRASSCCRRSSQVRSRTVGALGVMLEGAWASSEREEQRLRLRVIPAHRGLRGHPVALSAALAALITRDRAARDLADGIRRHARLVGYWTSRTAASWSTATRRRARARQKRNRAGADPPRLRATAPYEALEERPDELGHLADARIDLLLVHAGEPEPRPFRPPGVSRNSDNGQAREALRLRIATASVSETRAAATPRGSRRLRSRES